MISFKLDRSTKNTAARNILNAVFIIALTGFRFSMIAMRMNAILAAAGTALFYSEIKIIDKIAIFFHEFQLNNS